MCPSSASKGTKTGHFRDLLLTPHCGPAPLLKKKKLKTSESSVSIYLNKAKQSNYPILRIINKGQ